MALTKEKQIEILVDNIIEKEEQVIEKTEGKIYEYIADPDIIMGNFDILSKKYRPLMWKYIRLIYNMHSKAVEINDLEQEANIALMNCIKNFDKGRKVYFQVYLGKAVLNKLLCYCRNTLPHYYKKDPEKEGKFVRVKVFVETLDNPQNPIY